MDRAGEPDPAKARLARFTANRVEGWTRHPATVFKAFSLLLQLCCSALGVASIAGAGLWWHPSAAICQASRDDLPSPTTSILAPPSRMPCTTQSSRSAMRALVVFPRGPHVLQLAYLLLLRGCAPLCNIDVMPRSPSYELHYAAFPSPYERSVSDGVTSKLFQHSGACLYCLTA